MSINGLSFLLTLLGCLGCFCLGAAAATIETVAGNGSAKNNGDEGIAQEIVIGDPFGVEFGPDGALYVTEVRHHRIRRVDRNRISTVAGTGKQGYSGDGGPATKACLNEPYEVRFDKVGNMYFVEMQNNVIRRVDARTGFISTVAGTGKQGFSGDGGPARRATFSQPHSIALDNRDHLYVADIGNHRIRRINLESGIVETVAGTGEQKLPVDGQQAKGKPIFGPRALFITGDTLWIALREGNSVWEMNLESSILNHVAGSGEKGFKDGEPGEATFNGPKGIVVDGKRNVFVVDTENHVIRRIDGQTSSTTTVVGNGKRGNFGDGGDALQAAMDRPHGICLGPNDALFIGDTLNHRVRFVKD